MTYKTALETLAGRYSKTVANNTVLHRNYDDLAHLDRIALRLHSTDILIFHRDGSVTATSGGWKTSTTKDRLNSYLPHGWRVYQAKGVWYWYKATVDWETWGAPATVSVAPGSGTPFTDGDRIGPRGALHAQAPRSRR